MCTQSILPRTKLIIIGSVVTFLLLCLGVGLTVSAKYYVSQICDEDSSKFSTFIIYAVHTMITVPAFEVNISTSKFPQIVPIDTTVETQYGPVQINTTVPLDFPPFIQVTTALMSLPVNQLIGNTTTNSLLASTQIISDVCAYLSPAIYVLGTICTVLLVWLSVLSFTFAIKICDHSFLT